MHELSVCQALLDEVERVASVEGAKSVRSISIQVGPLSGVEAVLLERAFEVARCGTVAEQATLRLESTRVRVRCIACAAEREVPPNRLLCGSCGDYRTHVIEGDELILSSIEMDIEIDAENAEGIDSALDPKPATRSGQHV